MTDPFLAKLDAAIAKHDAATRGPPPTDDQRAQAIESIVEKTRHGDRLAAGKLHELTAAFPRIEPYVTVRLAEPLPHLGGNRTPEHKKSTYERPNDSGRPSTSVPSIPAPSEPVLVGRLPLRDAPMPTRPGYSSSASQWWQPKTEGGWLGG